MANTLQVDGLVRISGLTPAPYKTHPQPPKDIHPRLIKYVAVGTLIILVDRDYELPANKAKTKYCLVLILAKGLKQDLKRSQTPPPPDIDVLQTIRSRTKRELQT